MIDLAHHALLIFGRQQRQQRRHLVGAGVVPDAPSLRHILAVSPVPFGHRFVGVLRRPASRFRVGHQRLVVILRGLERIGAHDVLARPIHLAVSPARRPGRIAADSRVGRARAGAAAAHVGNLPRGVAAPVPLVRPQRAILVEVLGREHVHGKRLYAVGRLPVPRRALAVSCAHRAADSSKETARPAGPGLPAVAAARTPTDGPAAIMASDKAPAVVRTPIIGVPSMAGPVVHIMPDSRLTHARLFTDEMCSRPRT